jgi:hypothetical protein
MSNHGKSNSLATKALAERLAIRLKRSIGQLHLVLTTAKKDGISIPEACRKLGKHSNYVNTAFFFLNQAERKNKLKLQEVTELEAMRTKLKSRSGPKTSKTPVSNVTSSRKSGTCVENAIAGMRHAVENRLSMFDASLAIGKSSSFLSMCVSTVDKMKSSEEQKEQLKELYAEYKKMVASGQIKLKFGQRKSISSKRTPRHTGTGALERKKHISSIVPSALRNITEGNVEYKYALVTDRPLRKIQKTYPLEVMRPGHSFAVPYTKGEMMAAKKAVTLFAKSNPNARFIQAKEGRELVIWRTE